ncbi:MAG: penicillin acylase family protein [Gammaproteobacteria bacterium]
MVVARKRRRRPLRWIGVGVLVLILLVAAAILAGWLLMRGSLPETSGSVRMPGLAAEVTVTRDAHGMPTIRAHSELDAWRVLGYVEAQDRFVQMDLMRRLAAGDLAALVGPAAVPLDREHRVFRLQAEADRIYAQASPADRARLQVFALGVNEGLAALKVRPWPYLLLRARPKPWRPADSVLVIYAMAFQLQNPRDRRGRSLAAFEALYPPAVVKFLMAPDAYWAAPMQGAPPAAPPIPGTSAINFAALPAASATAPIPASPPATGSNNFAVAGKYTKSGLPLLSNDMHLGLAVPPTWYRARLVFPALAPPHQQVSLTGVFLPGIPALVAGTNGHIAWGLTNSYGDWVDIVRVPVSGTPPVYAVPGGTASVANVIEMIGVHGAKAVPFTVQETRWGPVIGKAPDGALLVSHWSLLQPGGVNLDFLHLTTAASVKEAFAVAAGSGIPAQNFLVVDAAGHIGWTVAGRIPARLAGCDYGVPESWADGHCGWAGWLAPDAYPRIVDPASGFLATANNHVDATAAGDVLGDGGYADGARAHQIVSDLGKLTTRGGVTPADMLGVQLDDRADFLSRWHDLMLEVLRPSALEYHPRRKALREEVAHWGGHAAVDSVGYRMVRAFRLQVAKEAFAPIFVRLKTRYSDTELPFDAQKEGPLWRLVTAQPKNWLNARFPTWNALFLNAIDGLIERYWKKDGGFSRATWGQRNTVRVNSPFARALGPFGGWLNMPAIQLPGDKNMPRVQAPTFGASMRLDTAPAASAPGILELPGGESEHPLSPWYKDEFMAWAHGEAMPLAPGPAKTTLHFKPWPRTLIAPATAAGSAAVPGS